MFFSLHNPMVVKKIVGKLSEKTYDIVGELIVGELKKCGKFESVLVSSS